MTAATANGLTSVVALVAVIVAIGQGAHLLAVAWAVVAGCYAIAAAIRSTGAAK